MQHGLLNEAWMLFLIILRRVEGNLISAGSSQPVSPHILLSDSYETPLCVDWCVQWLTEHAVLHVVLCSGHLSSHHIELWLPALFVATDFSLFRATDLPAFWALCVKWHVLSHTRSWRTKPPTCSALGWLEGKTTFSDCCPRLKSSSFPRTESEDRNICESTDWELTIITETPLWAAALKKSGTAVNNKDKQRATIFQENLSDWSAQSQLELWMCAGQGSRTYHNDWALKQAFYNGYPKNKSH